MKSRYRKRLRSRSRSRRLRMSKKAQAGFATAAALLGAYLLSKKFNKREVHPSNLKISAGPAGDWRARYGQPKSIDVAKFRAPPPIQEIDAIDAHTALMKTSREDVFGQRRRRPRRSYSRRRRR